MSLSPRLQYWIEIDGIRLVPADVASLVLTNSSHPAIFLPRSCGKSAGPELELNLQCKLAKPPLIVVAARSQRSKSAPQLLNIKRRSCHAGIVKG